MGSETPVDEKRRVRGPSHRPIPDDFARHARVEGDIKLKRRYRVGQAVILRWRASTGIYCGQPRGPRALQKRKCSPSMVTTRRQKPYKWTPMTEKLSWYDAEDDIASLGVDLPRTWGGYDV